MTSAATDTDQDFYNILGVSRTASQEEVKLAYHRLARKHHPDRGGNEEYFRAINEAYATIGDATKRNKYDNPAKSGKSTGAPPYVEPLAPVLRLNLKIVDFDTVVLGANTPERIVLIYNDGGDASCQLVPESGSFWKIAGETSEDAEAWAQLIVNLVTSEDLDPGRYEQNIKVLLENDIGIAADRLTVRVNLVAAATKTSREVPPPTVPPTVPPKVPPKVPYAPRSTARTGPGPSYAAPRRRRNRIRLGAVIGVAVIAIMAWNNLSNRGNDQTGTSSNAVAPVAEATVDPVPTPDAPITVEAPIAPAQPVIQPAPTIKQLTANAQAEINKEIAGLSLNCIFIPYCPVFPVGFTSYIPVFVSGIDDNMLRTLEEWGYRDRWTDNHGRSLSSFNGTGSSQAQLITSPNTAGDFTAGLTYNDSSGTGVPDFKRTGDGANSTNVEWTGGRPWIIYWTLFNRSGKAVRKLQYVAQTFQFDVNVNCDTNPIPKSRECIVRGLDKLDSMAAIRTIKRPALKPYIPVPIATPSG